MTMKGLSRRVAAPLLVLASLPSASSFAAAAAASRAPVRTVQYSPSISTFAAVANNARTPLPPYVQPLRSGQTRRRCDSPRANLDVLGWSVLLAYELYSKRFTAAWSSQNAEARAVWTRYILEKGDYILGVQTLRNALTSASFFSTACITCLSLLISVGSTRIGTLSRLGLVKFSVASLLSFGASLSYLQSVRYMNTCAFLFQVANDQRDDTCSRGTVMLLMVLSQNCWAAGERLLYMLMPAIVWLAGGGAALCTFLVGFLPLLYYKDLPAPTNLLNPTEPSLEPYSYLRNGPLQFLDVFGFTSALSVAQATVAKSGDYVKDKYGLDAAVWPPRKPSDA